MYFSCCSSSSLSQPANKKLNRLSMSTRTSTFWGRTLTWSRVTSSIDSFSPWCHSIHLAEYIVTYTILISKKKKPVKMYKLCQSFSQQNYTVRWWLFSRCVPSSSIRWSWSMRKLYVSKSSFAFLLQFHKYLCYSIWLFVWSTARRYAHRCCICARVPLLARNQLCTFHHVNNLQFVYVPQQLLKLDRKLSILFFFTFDNQLSNSLYFRDIRCSATVSFCSSAHSFTHHTTMLFSILCGESCADLLASRWPMLCSSTRRLPNIDFGSLYSFSLSTWSLYSFQVPRESWRCRINCI